ncbi:hypothetical protein [Roseobacter sp. CCS2]|uniref:hypothetical protein n=1 Tax=Roseobacter sp. CCS2 TaxID=391593 RepID=UPI0000F3E48B|nr:hypothetical protein [Roseobacter sp. CCS2]EBA12588.1 hypothetical protein RCCS2_14864 [Roseobacter sp. CCS2]
MKSRWQKSLEAAVAAYDTPMPWARGDIRKAMISRREMKANDDQQPHPAVARRA